MGHRLERQSHVGRTREDEPGGSASARLVCEAGEGLGMTTVVISDAGGLLGAAAREGLRARAEQAAGVLGCSGEVRVKVIGDEEMSAAHVRYSGVEGTTDVLTFDLADGGAAKGEPLDVDIFVCVDEARRRATELGHDMERELLLYVVHGVLHCLGHDDHDEAGYARMHALEDGVLRAIGVGAVFDPKRGGAA